MWKLQSYFPSCLKKVNENYLLQCIITDSLFHWACRRAWEEPPARALHHSLQPDTQNSWRTPTPLAVKKRTYCSQIVLKFGEAIKHSTSKAISQIETTLKISTEASQQKALGASPTIACSFGFSQEGSGTAQLTGAAQCHAQRFGRCSPGPKPSPAKLLSTLQGRTSLLRFDQGPWSFSHLLPALQEDRGFLLLALRGTNHP